MRASRVQTLGKRSANPTSSTGDQHTTIGERHGAHLPRNAPTRAARCAHLENDEEDLPVTIGVENVVLPVPAPKGVVGCPGFLAA
jgi:hypothetical protein